jgi:hypothetical protein
MPTELRDIYLSKITEAIDRLRASESFLANWKGNSSLANLEAAILQVRKALEAIAFASIAPNKEKYEVFRSRAEEQPDFTKDYHAGKIFKVLSKINKNFFPIALTPASSQQDGPFHFDRKCSGILTKKRFESIYDRLGKHLHSYNPWSDSKNLEQLATELSIVISEAFELLELHATFIQAIGISVAWVVVAKRDGDPPYIITAEAKGEFLIQDC